MTILDELIVTFQADTAPMRRDLALVARETEQAGKRIGQAFPGLDIINDALGKIPGNTKTASDAFRTFADTLLQELERIALDKFVRGPLEGFFGSVFSDIGSAVFSSPVTPRAEGGPVGPGKTFLVGEKGPELLRLGSQSGFITPNKALGGGPVNVNVINNSSAEIQTQQRIQADGSREIDVLIDDLMARNIRRPGSKSGKAFRETFGTAPVTIGR